MAKPALSKPQLIDLAAVQWPGGQGGPTAYAVPPLYALYTLNVLKELQGQTAPTLNLRPRKPAAPKRAPQKKVAPAPDAVDLGATTDTTPPDVLYEQAQPNAKPTAPRPTPGNEWSTEAIDTTPYDSLTPGQAVSAIPEEAVLEALAPVTGLPDAALGAYLAPLPITGGGGGWLAALSVLGQAAIVNNNHAGAAAVAAAAAGSTAGASSGSTAPSVAAKITAISNDTGTPGDLTTKTAAQTLSGSYTGTLAAGDKIQVLVGNTWTDATTTPNASGGTFTLSGVALLEGANNFGVRVHHADNTDTAGTGISVKLDTAIAAPTIALATGVADNTIGLGETQLTVTVKGSAAQPLKEGDSLQLLNGTSPFGTAHTVTAAEASANAVTLPVSNTDLGNVNGSYPIHAKVSDAAGNSATTTAAQDVSLSIVAPTLTNAISADTAPIGTASGSALLSDLITQTAAQNLSGNYTGTLAAGDKIQVKATDASTWTDATTTTPNASGGGSFSLNNFNLSDGTHSYEVRVVNGAGTSSNLGNSISATLDTVAPQVQLAISSTNGKGTTLSGNLGDNTITTGEASLWLKISEAGSNTFKAGDVVTLQQKDGTGTFVDLLDTTGKAYTATVGSANADGGTNTANGTYIKVDTSLLAAGASTLQVSAHDLAGNSTTSNSIGVTHTGVFSLSNAAMVAGSATAIEVDSQIVLTASQTLTGVVAGKTITLVNDAVTAGYEGENTTHTFVIDAGDSRYVSISGNTITIKPTFDFDFGNTYHVTVDAGAFTAADGSSAAVTATTGLHFSTVAVGSALDSAVQGYKFAADGTLETGKQWFSIDGTGSTDTAVNLDLSGGDYAMVLKDVSAAPGFDTKTDGTTNDGVGVVTQGFHVSVTGFDGGDRIYADDQNNNKAQLNNADYTDIRDDGDHTLTVQFNPEIGTNSPAGVIAIDNTGGANSVDSVRGQVAISNTQHATTGISLTRVNADGSDNSADTSIDTPDEELYAQVTADNLAAGDKVQLVYTDDTGALHNIGTAVTVSAQDPGPFTLHLGASDMGVLPNNSFFSLFAQITATDGFVSNSANLGGLGQQLYYQVVV